MMRNKYIILYCLMFLPIIVTLILMPYLPSQIPAHYDLSGNITRWGSKYEALITPSITFLMGYFFILTAKYVRKNHKDKAIRDEKILIITGIAVIVYFNVMTYISIFKYMNATNDITNVEVDYLKVISIMLGVLMIVLGNIMPKASNNKFFGLRTSWSMANDKSWFLSQRMAGKVFVIFGVIIVICTSIFYNGLKAFVFANILLMICVVWSIVYSRVAYKKSINK